MNRNIYDKSKFDTYMLYKNYEIMLQKTKVPSIVCNVVAFKRGTAESVYQLAGACHFGDLVNRIKESIDKADVACTRGNMQWITFTKMLKR